FRCQMRYGLLMVLFLTTFDENCAGAQKKLQCVMLARAGQKGLTLGLNCFVFIAVGGYIANVFKIPVQKLTTFYVVAVNGGD
ncbi:unnamed protein product, partial [Allacma fusca]